MENKKPWASKSLWVGLIMAIAPFLPLVGDKITSEIAVSVLGVVVMGLRLLTKKEISLKD